MPECLRRFRAVANQIAARTCRLFAYTAVRIAPADAAAFLHYLERRFRCTPLRHTTPRMRILHVLFSSRIAGSERYCIDLANRQAAAGHDVHVAGVRGAPLQRALSNRVRYHPFGWLLRGVFLRRLVTRLSPDICHGHLSAACKALRGVSTHHQTVATLHVGYKAHQHAWLGGLICVNRQQAGRLDGYRGMARTIPNWLPAMPASSGGGGIRRELGLADDVFVIGAVGRLHRSKGMDVLVSAFQASAPVNAALVILGDGPQLPELERLRGGDSRIHFLGYRPITRDCLHDLDLFVSPSREESFGLAIVEAMSAGVPMVATAAEGPREFLLDQPVTLVAPGSIDELTAALGFALRDRVSSRRLRINYDLSLFDPSARVGNILDFYHQVIEAGQWSPARQPVTDVAVAT
jgi:glycosyltransferase involved in cell wall biosynthesis